VQLGTGRHRSEPRPGTCMGVGRPPQRREPRALAEARERGAGPVSGPSAAELARRLADDLEASGIPHAIGGAIALGVWGFPRATKDVDVDVFVEIDGLEPVFRCSNEPAAPSTARRPEPRRSSGETSGVAGPMRVDVFVPSIPFYESMRRRIRQAELEGRKAWFLSPEASVRRISSTSSGSSQPAARPSIGSTCGARSSTSSAPMTHGSRAGRSSSPTSMPRLVSRAPAAAAAPTPTATRPPRR